MIFLFIVGLFVFFFVRTLSNTISEHGGLILNTVATLATGAVIIGTILQHNMMDYRLNKCTTKYVTEKVRNIDHSRNVIEVAISSSELKMCVEAYQYFTSIRDYHEYDIVLLVFSSYAWLVGFDFSEIPEYREGIDELIEKSELNL